MVCLCEVAQKSHLPGLRKRRGCEGGGEGSSGTPGVSELLPRMSPPHPDRPLATQGWDEPRGFGREKDA